VKLDLAGVEHPGDEFRGRKVLRPRGKSWVPFLSGGEEVVHDENAIHGWERKCIALTNKCELKSQSSAKQRLGRGSGKQYGFLPPQAMTSGCFTTCHLVSHA
jgi:hypothetical protein